MNIDYVIKIQQVAVIVLLFIAGIFVTSCDEKIVIGEVDETLYLKDVHPNGYLKDAATTRKTHIVYLRDHTDIQLCFGVSVTSNTSASARIGIDENLVASYNMDNSLNYKVFPAANVTFANGGNVSVAAWQKESDKLSMTISKDDLEIGTYLLPVVIKESSIETLENQVVYYFVHVTSAPNIEKISAQTGAPLAFLAYVGGDALPVIPKYVLEDSRKPLFDYVILFSVRAYDVNPETGEVTLNLESFKKYLNEHEKYIKPLQEQGTKVLLGLLGGLTYGLANMSGQMLTEFAANIKLVIDECGLDGYDWDDEWASYPDNISHPKYPEWAASNQKTARLMLEMKRIMPDKIFSVYEYNSMVTSVGGASFSIDGQTVRDKVDLGRNPYYTGNNIRATSQFGLSNDKYSPVAFWPFQGSNGWTQTQMNNYFNGTAWKNGRYGHLFFYQVTDQPEYLTQFNWITPIVYEERTILLD